MEGKWPSIVAVFLAFSCLQLRPLTQVNEPAALWERIVEAKGGRERLRGVHTIVVSTSQSLAGFTRPDVTGGLQYEIVTAFPDRFWWWEDYRPGKLGFAISVWNRLSKRQWRAADGGLSGPNRWGPASERNREVDLIQLAYLIETSHFKPVLVRLEQKQTPGGARVVLEGRAPGMQMIRYIVDPATAIVEQIEVTLLLRTGASGPEIPASRPEIYSFSGWTTVAGIRMPERNGNTNLRFLINPDIDPTLFETPPDNVTRADAWKKFLRK